MTPLFSMLRKFVINPLDGYEKILIPENNKLVYLLPTLYGLIYGASITISKFGLTHFGSVLGHLISDTLLKILFVFIFCYVYAWIILFISQLLKGISNINLTFSLVSYSLIPMIIGVALILAFKVIIDSIDLSKQSLYYVNMFLFYFQYLFVLWSLYILIIGNAMINDFSKIKSSIATVGLVIFLMVIGYLFP